jgi:hypothetical protein
MDAFFDLHKVFKSPFNSYFLVGYLKGNIELSRKYVWDIYNEDKLLGSIIHSHFEHHLLKILNY